MTASSDAVVDRSAVRIPVGTPVAEAERQLILTTLAHYDGNKAKAADVLGISLKTLYNRLHEYERGSSATDSNQQA
jgi:DNA-binding NtrC family response regulator